MKTAVSLVALAALLLGTAIPAIAGCPSPYEPSVSESDDVLRLNYYAEGSVTCLAGIVRELCGASCKDGYRHRCEAGGLWQPLEKCLDLEKKKALEEAATIKSKNEASAEAERQAKAMQQMEMQSEMFSQTKALRNKYDIERAVREGKGPFVGSGNQSPGTTSSGLGPSDQNEPGRDCPTRKSQVRQQAAEYRKTNSEIRSNYQNLVQAYGQAKIDSMIRANECMARLHDQIATMGCEDIMTLESNQAIADKGAACNAML